MWDPSHLMMTAQPDDSGRDDDEDDEVIAYNHGASETLLDILSRIRGTSGSVAPQRQGSTGRASLPRPSAQPLSTTAATQQPPRPAQVVATARRSLSEAVSGGASAAPRHSTSSGRPSSTRRSDDYGAMFDVWVPDTEPVAAGRSSVGQTSRPSTGVVAPSLLAVRRALALRDDDVSPIGDERLSTGAVATLQSRQAVAAAEAEAGFQKAAAAERLMDHFTVRAPPPVMVSAEPQVLGTTAASIHQQRGALVGAKSPYQNHQHPSLTQALAAAGPSSSAKKPRTILDLDGPPPPAVASSAAAADKDHSPTFHSVSSRNAFSRLLDQAAPLGATGATMMQRMDDLLDKAPPAPNPGGIIVNLDTAASAAAAVASHGAATGSNTNYGRAYYGQVLKGRGGGVPADRLGHPLSDEALHRVEFLFAQWTTAGDSRPTFKAHVEAVRNRLGVVLLLCRVTGVADRASAYYHDPCARFLSVGKPVGMVLTPSVLASTKLAVGMDVNVGRPVCVIGARGVMPPIVWPGACIQVASTGAVGGADAAPFRYAGLLTAMGAPAGAAGGEEPQPQRPPAAVGTLSRGPSQGATSRSRAPSVNPGGDGVLLVDGLPLGPGDEWSVSLAELAALVASRVAMQQDSDNDTPS